MLPLTDLVIQEKILPEWNAVVGRQSVVCGSGLVAMYVEVGSLADVQHCSS